MRRLSSVEDSRVATTLGTHSPKLDAARALRTKAGRQAQQRYAVEGTALLGEALAAGLRPETLFVTEAGLRSLEALEAAPPLEERTFIVPQRAMERLSDLETPPGILTVLPLLRTRAEDIFRGGKPALVLAGIADPGNAGTLLRSADIFGIGAALFAGSAVEPHNPKVVRATMGAFFRMQLAEAEPGELLLLARRYGYTIVAAMRDATPLPFLRFPQKALIAVGSERHGVAGCLPSWDIGVSIPQPGAGESLNAAVAGSIVLYAFSQQTEPVEGQAGILGKP